MATLTIRDLDDDVKRRLRMRAAEKGVSMEAEVRGILADSVRDDDEPGAWLKRIRARFEQIGWADELEIPARDVDDGSNRRMPTFDE